MTNLEEGIIVVEAPLVADLLHPLEVLPSVVQPVQSAVDQSHGAHIANLSPYKHPQTSQIVVLVCALQLQLLKFAQTLRNFYLRIELLSLRPLLQKQNNSV